MGWTYFPEFINVLMSNESKEAIKKYNLEAFQKFKDRTVQEVLCCLDGPAPTPGAEPEDHDLKTLDDSILDLINNQAPNDEQLEQALQTIRPCPHKALLQPLIDL